MRGAKADQREQLVVARVATVLLATLSIVLGIAFKGQNVAYMVGLAFAIAASANFPALVLSIFWSRLTTAGAQSSMIVGTLAALLLIYFSPTIQVDILHRPDAWFPLRNPGIVSIPLSFAVAIVVSLLRPCRPKRGALRSSSGSCIWGSRVRTNNPSRRILICRTSDISVREVRPDRRTCSSGTEHVGP